MSKFYYDVEKVKDVQIKINSLQSDLDHAKSKLNANIFALSTQNRPLLSALGSKKDGVKACINSMRNDMKNIDVLKERIGLLNSTLEDITTLVTECEDDAQFKIEGFKEYNGDNPAFDDVGQFGGDQGSPKGAFYRDVIRNWKDILFKDVDNREFGDLANIVKKYYPNMSGSEIMQYLKDANEHGCGYVAFTNTIFDNYKNNPEDFEKTFGFPMYKNGDLNFNQLFIDYFAYTCSKYYGGNPTAIATGVTDFNNAVNSWESYCKEHNIDTNVDTQIDIKNYDKISKKGQVIIWAQNDWTVCDPQTGEKKHYKGGHAMCVIGITPDGRYIVSSWGKQYYLEINSDTKYSFLQTQYK